MLQWTQNHEKRYNALRRDISVSAKLKGVLTGVRVLQPPLKMMQTSSYRCME